MLLAGMPCRRVVNDPPQKGGYIARVRDRTRAIDSETLKRLCECAEPSGRHEQLMSGRMSDEESLPVVQGGAQAVLAPASSPPLHALRALLSGGSLSELLTLPEAELGVLLRLLSPFTASYTTGRVLGRGGFGVVLAATNVVDGREVALKRVTFCSSLPPWTPSAVLAEAHEPLLREARVLTLLKHAAVVTLYSAWIEPHWERILEATAPVPSADEPTVLRLCSRPSSVPSSFSRGSMSTDTLQSEEEETASLSLALVGAADGRKTWPWCLYIAMELVAGPTLASYLAMRCDDDDAFSEGGAALSPDAAAVAASVARQVAEGLAALHASGVIHRDLKPMNVVLQWPKKRTSEPHTPRAVIVDLGLAARESLETPSEQSESGSDGGAGGDKHTAGVGTAAYSAPEQSHPSGQYSASADVYSFGLMLCELLIPWRSQSERVEVLSAARAGCLPLSRLDASLPGAGALAGACLCAQPGKRMSAAEVAAAAPLRREGGGGLAEEVAKLKMEVRERDAEIARLRAAKGMDNV
jgi:serine/threonine protein kinase